MKDATVIVIPSYNEERAIGGVVLELKTSWPHVVVVDDGSSDDTGAVASRNGATVLTHIVNRGQGAALQTGIAFALERGARVIVTFDSDGQHRAEDVAALVKPIEEGRADAVLGSRFLGSTESMTRRRRLLLRAAVLFTRVTSGARVTDAHNGLRAFSAEAARKIHIQLDRMAHASEIVDQIAARGIRFVEVPVHVRYSDYSRRKGQSSLGAFRVLFDYLWSRWLR
ncbi:MAG TPA: glycosyltransferase family 2 protein [Thermoanaerobaculia bacterium]|nr:glycosyltransferase family 2 protein [Thermoanaerobaculia bacterium]